MKIGIVTWFRSGNFGTNLQAIALYQFLSQNNDVSFVSYFDSERLFSNKKTTKILYILRNILKYPLSPYLYYRRIKECKNVIKGIKIQNSFRKLKICNIFNSKRLYKFDAFITGSDQIWNPYYLKKFYLLDFVPVSIPRLSYSSSIGVDEIPNEKQEVYRRNLLKFKNLAVRENTGEILLKELLNRDDIRTVMDPVFLLSADEWKVKLHLNENNDKYIFCYFVGNTNDNGKAIEQIMKKTGIKKLIYVPAQEYNEIKLDGFCDASAGNRDFLSYIASASLVCTDSFHATAFSLIFNRQFIEFKRFSDNDSKSQNSRIVDILSKYGLQSRLYTDNFDYSIIDYKFVNEKLNKDIIDSKEYLESVLSGCKK